MSRNAREENYSYQGLFVDRNQVDAAHWYLDREAQHLLARAVCLLQGLTGRKSTGCIPVAYVVACAKENGSA